VSWRGECDDRNKSSIETEREDGQSLSVGPGIELSGLPAAWEARRTASPSNDTDCSPKLRTLLTDPASFGFEMVRLRFV
jgi:hypothetical protein